MLYRATFFPVYPTRNDSYIGGEHRLHRLNAAHPRAPNHTRAVRVIVLPIATRVCIRARVIYLILESERSGLEPPELFHKTIIWISLLSLRFDKLECIFKFHREQAHDKHDDAGG